MNTFALALYLCHGLSTNNSTFEISQIRAKQTSQNQAQVEMMTSQGPFNFFGVEYAVDNSTDHLALFTHDHFSFVLDLESNPIQGVINPFIKDGEATGPLYFECTSEQQK